MYKFLKQLFFFFLYAVTVYFLLIIVWGEFMPGILKKNLNYSLGAYGHMYTRTREVEKFNMVDILFAGASHAYRGFDTRIAKEYGYQSFNLGSSAQTPVQTKLILEKYLDKLQPKMVILEVCRSTFTNDGIESSMDMIANGKIDFKVLEMAVALNHIKTYNSLVYGYYRQLFNRNKNFEESVVIKEDTYIPGGYVERKMMNNAGSIVADTTENKKTKWEPKKYQLTAFEAIIKLIKEKGIKLILVQAPINIKKLEYRKYIDNDIIDSYFSSKATYFNFNNFLNLSDSLDFYNKDHLNQNGVRIFNKNLFDSILEKK